MAKLNLANKQQREYFLGAYSSWDLIHKDTVNKFEYFQHKFDSGDRLVALRYQTNSKIGVGVIFTLVSVGEKYVPIESPKMYIYNYLIALHHEQKSKEEVAE